MYSLKSNLKHNKIGIVFSFLFIVQYDCFKVAFPGLLKMKCSFSVCRSLTVQTVQEHASMIHKL
jgi:hypothetical protein